MRAVVNVTSDKCYENREWEWGYREDEPMGGHDPYSNSKGCAELVTGAYRRSFFARPTARALASARAGNVIGGGDWGEDRLVPDIMRAALAGEVVHVRNPNVDPAVAARAEPAQRLPRARPGAVGLAASSRAAGTSARRGGRAAGGLARRATRRAVAGAARSGLDMRMRIPARAAR